MRCDYLDGADYLYNRGTTITRLVSWWRGEGGGGGK